MKTIEHAPTPSAPSRQGGTWLREWTPEDPAFFDSTGSKVAWRTLSVTTFCLLLAFATWFMVSAIVTKLQGLKFQLDTMQIFWLTAMPGLAAGSLRIVHTFLIPIFGTRHTVAVSTLLLAVPCVGWGMAVQDPGTPYWVLLVLAFLAGFGGGNFSSFMPSTSLFFPKRLQGTALGIQAGVGNFGVSVTQFLVPAVITVSMLAALGAPQTFEKGGKTSQIYLQNAAYVWIPFILLGTILAWMFLRSVPVKATFREQTDIFRNKHTWLMTSLYIMTFGSFSGFAMTFPVMIGKVYGKFGDAAPEPLAYAFLGPLVGAGIRVLFGPVSDKLGGARVTTWSALGLIACTIGVTFFVEPTSMEQWSGFLWLMLGIFLFSGMGNASTFKQMPMIFEPRQAAGVIGWTSAIAAYGPFIFSVLIGLVISSTGSPKLFFYGAAAFYVINLWINWHFYARKGAEKPC